MQHIVCYYLSYFKCYFCCFFVLFFVFLYTAIYLGDKKVTFFLYVHMLLPCIIYVILHSSQDYHYEQIIIYVYYLFLKGETLFKALTIIIIIIFPAYIYWQNYLLIIIVFFLFIIFVVLKIQYYMLVSTKQKPGTITLADTISDLIFNGVGSRNHNKIDKQVGLTA